MPRPTETPPASPHPLLTASMIPGPPPVMTAYPARARAAPIRSPTAYSGSSRLVRADPKTLTAAGSSASSPNPSTNSDWIRRTRHGSVCTQSDGPRESRSRWSVVLPSTAWSRRNVTGPRCFSRAGRRASDATSSSSRAVASGRRSGSIGGAMPIQSRVYLSGEISAQDALTLGDSGDLDVLLARMREVWVTGAEVHRGQPHRGEACDIGPAELGHGLAVDRGHEVGCRRFGQPRQRARRGVGGHDFVRREHLLDVGQRLRLVPVRREAVVDRDRAPVRNDVAGNTALDPDGVEPLAVLAAVEHHPAGCLRRKVPEDVAGPVDRVVAEPRPRRVRPASGHDDDDAHGALAAGLDPVRGRLHQDREIAL